MNKFTLYLDDTGFNADARYSQTLKDESVSYAGVLVDRELEPYLNNIVSELGKTLKQRYDTSEFHFSHIYNHKGDFENIQLDETLDICEMFADIFTEFDLPIIVHTVNSTPNAKTKNLYNGVDFIASEMHLPINDKSRAMLTTYFMSKKFVEENFKDIKIDKVVCDEGIRKNNAKEKIGEVEVVFKSSNECPILQIADFAAWMLNRTKTILDNISKKHQVNERDKKMLSIFSSIAYNYKNLSKLGINFEDLEKFNYDDTHKDIEDE